MWQSRSVFISSTFADMQAERDYLRTRVFPELEERLRGRRYNLEWVDLRVGVATASQHNEHVRELHVLKVCLDEVKRCRPFLIVLLGDRYGWVPPEHRISAAAEEARQGFSTDIVGCSVTDLEIEFGVLSDPEQQPRSFFYFRESLPYGKMQAETAAVYSEDYATDAGKTERKTRLEALKRRIEARLPGRIRPYRATWDNEHRRVGGLEEFGRMVLDDIWSELDAETRTSAAAEIPWQQAEREALEDFVDDRARDFVGRKEILDSLTDLATAGDADDGKWGACVTSDPGSGKSALFGELCHRLDGGEAFLLAHAAGASINAASVDSMLRRFITELAGALGTAPGLPEGTDSEEVEATFARLLGQLALRRRVVVLVDALDQFERTTRGCYLTWLPSLLPANVRFIATAIAGEASKSLAERQGLQLYSLPPIDAAEARDIVAGICRRYHRVFEPEVVDALLAKRGAKVPAWGNPLWLVLAVEDLNLLDADDFARAHRDYAGAPGERLRALMLDIVAGFPIDIPGLYAQTFQRAEDLFGTRVVQAYLSLIAVSRAGWRESDFRVLLPRASGEQWDELKFAQLRRLFRGQLRQCGALAQWDFSHGQMRAAVLAKLSAWSISENDANTLIADHLLSCPFDDPLHISETMVHLLGARDYDRAARYYGAATLSAAETQGATRVLAEAIIAPPTGTPAAAAREISRLLETADPSLYAQAADRFLFNLGDALKHRASLDCRLIIMDSAKQVMERLVRSDPNNAGWQRGLSVAYDRLGDLLKAQGDLPAALKIYRDSLAIRDHLAQTNPSNADWQCDMSVSFIWIGDALVAQGNLGEALKAYQKSVELVDPLTRTDPENTAWQSHLSLCLERVGDVLMARGDLVGALEFYQGNQAIIGWLARIDPSNAGLQRGLLLSYARLGDVLVARGNLSEALKCYRDTLAIAHRVARADPGNSGQQRDLALSYDKIGSVLVAQDNLVEALKFYRHSLAIKDLVARADPGNIGWQHDLAVSYNRIGNVLVAQSNLAEALNSYRNSLTIAERLVAIDPGNAGWQRDLAVTYGRLGDVLMAQDDLPEALKSHHDALAIFDRLTRADPHNASWQHDLSAEYTNVGQLLQVQGNLPEALKSYRDALAIADRLAHANPGNEKWQHQLLVSCVKIGDVLMAQDNLPEALKSYHDAFAIADRLAHANPGNAAWQRDLSVVYEKVGKVLTAQGNLPAALKSYRGALAIADRLADADPGNADWQRDLVSSYDKVGGVLEAQSNLPEALKSYRDALAIANRLADADPGNADWQRDLVSSYDKVGGVLEAQGNLPEALKSYRDALAIADRLVDADPGNDTWQLNLSVVYEKVGKVLTAQGNLPEALKSYRAVLAIRDRLASAYPGNGQHELSTAYTNVGYVLALQGNLPEALKYYRDALAIADRMAQVDPGSAGWQRDLSVAYSAVVAELMKSGEVARAS